MLTRTEVALLVLIVIVLVVIMGLAISSLNAPAPANSTTGNLRTTGTTRLLTLPRGDTAPTPSKPLLGLPPVRVGDFNHAVLATARSQGSDRTFLNIGADGVSVSYSSQPTNTYKYIRNRLYRQHPVDGETRVQYLVIPGDEQGIIHLASDTSGYVLREDSSGRRGVADFAILRRVASTTS